jgi:hypothetical protein
MGQEGLIICKSDLNTISHHIVVTSQVEWITTTRSEQTVLGSSPVR